MTPTSEVALLDCGQVKQLTSARRLALARLLVLINRWEKLEPLISSDNAALQEQRLLTSEIAQYMRDQGIEIRKEAGDECAVALALLLFGNSDAKLPGGFNGQELSPESPIAQVTNFPSEFILLGRATVMIKGIARRLNMEWGLSDRWSSYAREALATSNPTEVMPIWCVVDPVITTTERLGVAVRRGSSKGPIRFKEVLASLKSWFGLVKVC